MVVVNKSASSSSLLISAMEFFVPEAVTSAIDLDAKSPPRWRDTLFVFVFAAFFYVVRAILDGIIFDSLARRCLFGSSDCFKKSKPKTDSSLSEKSKIIKSKCGKKSSFSSPSLSIPSTTSLTASSSASSPAPELKKRSTSSSNNNSTLCNGHNSGGRNDTSTGQVSDNGCDSLRRRRRRKKEKLAADSLTSTSTSSSLSSHDSPSSSSPSSPFSAEKSKTKPRVIANGCHVDESSSSSPSTPTRRAVPLANGHVDDGSLPPPPPPPPNCQSRNCEKLQAPPPFNVKRLGDLHRDRDLPPSSDTTAAAEEEEEEEKKKKRRRRRSANPPPGKTMTTTTKRGEKKKEIEKMTDEEKVKLVRKFKEASWRVVYYVSAEIFFFSITCNEPWFGNTSAFWEGWPLQDVKLKLKAFYMYAGGYCVYSCFALFLWDAKRSDFFVTVCHHTTTILLVLFSYVNSFARVGSVVLAVHDANDIFLETAKMFVYTKVEIGSTIFFSLFVISWLLLRLIYFPFWVIYSTSFEVLQVLDVVAFPHAPYLYYFFNSLLITLLVLNLYWWLLISRMVIRMVKNKGDVGEDVRSDSEED